MPITVGHFATFKGFAVAPEDIQAGEAESKTLPVVSDAGQTLQAKFRRYSLQIVVRGIREGEASAYLLAAQQANLNLFRGSPQVEDIAVLGRVYRQCMLVDCEVTQPYTLNGTGLIEQMKLTYESQVFV
jgi:hypothetical protein